MNRPAVGPGQSRPGFLNGFDTKHAHPARVYDVWLGGKDGFAADREAAQQVAEKAPWVVQGARANRAFLRRAVVYLAGAGIDQFLDIGSGLPTSGNVHEIAQRVNPEARVVYVDLDPVVLVHARALLTKGSTTIAVAGDARDPWSILTDATVRGHLDFTRPVAVLFVAVLHFLSDEDNPAGVVGVFREALAPGSHVVISHVADLPDDQQPEGRADATREAAKVYQDLAAPFTLRTRAEIQDLFAGFELVQPGLIGAHEWRPARGRPGPSVPVLAGVGRLPETAQLAAIPVGEADVQQ